MPALTMDADGLPSVGEVRATLDRMIASDAFRASPQLVAFLRYVVEAKLRGEADRIKGYTIAVEALGRNADFDPQADPIVRVEAMRLRRALGRYHACASDNVVLIDLPLGSYVPVFRRCLAAAPLPQPVEAPAPPLPAMRPARRFALPPINWRHALTGAALVLLGAVAYGALDFWFDFNTPNPQAAFFGAQAGTVEPRSGPALPVVFVGPFQSTSSAGGAQAIADTLRAKLRDALARFDEISVMNGAPPEPRRAGPAGDSPTATRYGLTASVEIADASQLSVDIRLTDIADGRVAFARTFQHARAERDVVSAEEAIVREVSAVLAQPYGIIYSHERALQVGSAAGDPRYRCLLDAYEYWRTYEPAQHARVRECLERATEADPSFAAGFAVLAEIVLQEHRRGLNLRAGDAPPLDRALRAARTAVEVTPGSARAHQALMDVLFLRGDYALALAAGEKAVLLNPYNPTILASYGARLVGLGQVEKGARVLKEAAAGMVVRPAWFDFYLALAAYLSDDPEAAATYAAQIVSDKSLLGFVARALVTAQRGNPDAARQFIDRLVALRPQWRDDPRRELKKIFPADALADRLTQDLARAGLGVMN